jgi:hypothetical protein
VDQSANSKFLGSLEYSGNRVTLPGLGSHPQFRHLLTPTPHFRISGYPHSRTALLRALYPFAHILRPVHLLTLSKNLIEILMSGVKLKDWEYRIPFLLSRRPLSELTSNPLADYQFLPSIPNILSGRDWILEIEDVATLFYPFAQNGRLDNEVRCRPYIPFFKELLERSNCKAIITHVSLTKIGIDRIFGSSVISNKTHYVPCPISDVPEANTFASGYLGFQPGQELRVLFTNSWHQADESFYCRGGIDVVSSVRAARELGYPIELTLRTKLPSSLPLDLRKFILTDPGVTLVDQFLSRPQVEDMIARHHVYCLPSARLHVVSTLEMMARNLVVVCSDGWGFNDYVENKVSGLLVNGRWGACSWQSDSGWLCENYANLYFTNENALSELTAALITLFESKDSGTALVYGAKKQIQKRHIADVWNKRLVSILSPTQT